MALLETRNLSKSFGGLQAIDKVSLKVEPNTIHGLIGDAQRALLPPLFLPDYNGGGAAAAMTAAARRLR